jgi:hypothetical protein
MPSCVALRPCLFVTVAKLRHKNELGFSLEKFT